MNPGGTDGTYFQRVPLLGIQTDYSKSTAEIVNLYPGLDHRSADDAYELESRLRGTHEFEAA